MEPRDTSWHDALVVTPGRVAGVRLLPLSAWHLHAMQMFGVRCEWTNGRGPTPGDVAAAVAICRTRWSMERPGVPMPSWWLRARLGARWRVVDWRRDALALINHVRAYKQHPDVQVAASGSGSPGRAYGCPPYLGMAVDLCQRVPSVTFAEAMNMPMGWLALLRATACDVSGYAECAWNLTQGPRSEEVNAGIAIARAAIEREQAKEAERHG